MAETKVPKAKGQPNPGSKTVESVGDQSRTVKESKSGTGKADPKATPPGKNRR